MAPVLSREYKHRMADALRELIGIRAEFGGGAAKRKLVLLRALAGQVLDGSDRVLELHEVLGFLRAYPDNAAVLRQVRAMLRGFERREDLRAAVDSRELMGSGIAGTTIYYRFYAVTAKWLAERYPDNLFIDWSEFGNKRRLEHLLHLLTTFAETSALDEIDFPMREWIDLMRGDVPDGTFLVRRLQSLQLDSFTYEALCDDLDVPFMLRPGPGTPSRTTAGVPVDGVSYQRKPLRRRRPDLEAELAVPPESVRVLSAGEGRRYVDLAREAMVTRARDLDAFAYGDPRDVRLIDCGDGLQFAAIGVLPERRLLFEAVYGFLTLRNGVPMGYVLNSALFGSAEIAYNVFDTFRGGEAGWIYGRFLSALHHLLRVDTFTIYPFQLGHENDEALQSGAWWFYQKLGFRPRDPDVTRLMEREMKRMAATPTHRSGIATLKALSRENLYLHLGETRDDIIGELSLADVGLRVMEYMGERFGADREKGEQVLVREAARRLGCRTTPGATSGERLAWQRWAPVVVLLPELEFWSAGERRDVVRVILAKGGRRESDFVLRFDRHARLRAALLELAEA